MTYIRANSFAKQVFYQLEKQAAREIDLYVRGTVSQAVNTGRTSYSETKYCLRKAMVLTATQARQLAQATNFAVAGRPFEYGGYFATNGLFLIIKLKDLPLGYKQNNDDAFVIDHKRYNIKETQLYDEAQGMIFVVEYLPGQPVQEITGSKDNLYLTENASFTKGIAPPVASYIYNSNRVVIKTTSGTPIRRG